MWKYSLVWIVLRGTDVGRWHFWDSRVGHEQEKVENCLTKYLDSSTHFQTDWKRCTQLFTWNKTDAYQWLAGWVQLTGDTAPSFMREKEITLQPSHNSFQMLTKTHHHENPNTDHLRRCCFINRHRSVMNRECYTAAVWCHCCGESFTQLYLYCWTVFELDHLFNRDKSKMWHSYQYTLTTLHHGPLQSCPRPVNLSLVSL